MADLSLKTIPEMTKRGAKSVTWSDWEGNVKKKSWRVNFDRKMG